MASLAKRAVVLIFCRVVNYAVMLLSPMFLVRFFPTRYQYGQYSEFVLYATLLSNLLSFAISNNLIYFIPRYPDRERECVTQTTLLMLAASLVGCTLIYLCRGYILARTSFDFIVPLVLYTFLFLNLNYFDSYWLGKRRSDYVLYFTSARAAVHVGAAVVSAYVTRDVMTVVWTIIVVEAAKCLFLIAAFWRQFTRRLDGALIREQLRYIIPLGAASEITTLNAYLASLFVQLKMGVEQLAVYANGSKQIPIINIIRSSIIDVLFPEMTQTTSTERLRLWQRANVVVCFIVFPTFAIFFAFADTFIRYLFTAEYLSAVPLFRIYLVLMIIQSFEMGTPLRAINRNKYFMVGTIMGLLVNIGFIAVFFGTIGFLTPAFAFLLGELSVLAYIGAMVLRLYKVGIDRIFMWRKLGRLICAAIAASPLLVAGRSIGGPEALRVVAASLAYGGAYLLMVKQFRVDDVDKLFEKVRYMALRLRSASRHAG